MKQYVIKPSLQFYVVYEINGEDVKELTNEFEKDEKGNSVKIIQNIDKDTLTTKQITKYKLSNGIEIKNEDKQTMKMPIGTKLVYVKGNGYVLPERNICTIDEAIEDFGVLKEAL